MNAFEDIVTLYLEEEGYWVRQAAKVHGIKAEDKRSLGKPSLSTPEIDIVALKMDQNELVLIEVKSFLNSPGVKFKGVSGEDVKDAKLYKLFTNNAFRDVVTKRLRDEYLEQGLINEKTRVSYALACGHIYSTKKPKSSDEPKIRDYFQKMGWKLITPKDIKDKIRSFADKGWEDNVIIMTAKLTKEAVS